MDYAPIVRIVFRYVIGAGFMGSKQIGEALATDPDLVAAGCLVAAALIESAYAIAKKKGWTL